MIKKNYKMTAAEKKAYDHYNRVYLGKNGGATFMETILEIIGSVVIVVCIGALVWLAAAAF